MYGFDEFGPSHELAMSAQDAASVRIGAQVAGSGDAPTTACAAPIIRLPPVGSVGTWLTTLVDRDGPEDVVYALLQAVPAQRLMDIVEQLCARVRRERAHHLLRQRPGERDALCPAVGSRLSAS